MDNKIIPWNTGTWTNPPVSVKYQNGQMVTEAQEGSDYWEKTLYGFSRSSGHALLAPWKKGETVEVSFLANENFSRQYDQAGLMVTQPGGKWIKAALEMIDGVPCAVVVVTNGASDSSLCPMPHWPGGEVTMRVSIVGNALLVHGRSNGGQWQKIRTIPFTLNKNTLCGPLLCAPSRAGFSAAFTRWSVSVPSARDLQDT
ncbi:MAG: DUF1349 domain-containing protein [Christensenellales bacterium]